MFCYRHFLQCQPVFVSLLFFVPPRTFGPTFSVWPITCLVPFIVFSYEGVVWTCLRGGNHSKLIIWVCVVWFTGFVLIFLVIVVFAAKPDSSSQSMGVQMFVVTPDAYLTVLVKYVFVYRASPSVSVSMRCASLSCYFSYLSISFVECCFDCLTLIIRSVECIPYVCSTVNSCAQVSLC